MDKRRLILAFVALLALGTAAHIFGLPSYRHWKERNSVRQAQEFFATGDFRNATLSARNALAINTNNAAACRVMAGIAESVRAPDAVAWRQRVVDAEPASFTNRLELVRTTILLGRYDQAAHAISAIPDAYRDTATFHQVAAMVAIGLNQIALAERHLTRISELEPTNKVAQLNRAVIHLQAKDRDIVSGALKTLEQLYHDPACHRDALRHLAMAAARHGELEKTVALTEELQTAPDASLNDRLMHLSALQAAKDATLTEYLARVEAHCANQPESASVLMAWLMNHQLADEAARWAASLPPEIQTNSAVRLARADVFVARGDWAGLRAFAAAANWGSIDFVRHAMHGRALRELGEELAAQNEWRAATRGAIENEKQLALLARLADSWRWRREQEELLWNIIQRFPSERWALTSLNQRYLADGDTRGLHRVYSTLISLSPDDLGAKNNFAAVSLLLNMQTNQAHEFARDVYLRAKTNAAFASTYAYSLHLQGRAAEALATLQALTPAQLEDPGVALYYGALQSAKAPDAAKKYLDLAERGKLLPEEKSLLVSARGGL